MSENFEDRIRDIESRKRSLEDQINQRQEEISRRATHLKDEIEDRLRPEEIIRKHPVAAMGVTFGAGFLLARLITGGSHQHSPAQQSAPRSGKHVSNLMSDMTYDFLSAAKDMALGYAVDYASQLIQSKLENKKPKA
ncbi:MAG: hypothetical protein HGB19_04705 [Chlorobiales bacterium]|nr:hypothetical protein [Chlorobiales bacterium]